MKALTHYEVLKVTATVSDADLKIAYRRRLRETHPDTGGNSADFILVQNAWEALKTPNLRAQYDSRLQRERTTTTYTSAPRSAQSTHKSYTPQQERAASQPKKTYYADDYVRKAYDYKAKEEFIRETMRENERLIREHREKMRLMEEMFAKINEQYDFYEDLKKGSEERIYYRENPHGDYKSHLKNQYAQKVNNAWNNLSADYKIYRKSNATLGQAKRWQVVDGAFTILAYVAVVAVALGTFVAVRMGAPEAGLWQIISTWFVNSAVINIAILFVAHGSVNLAQRSRKKRFKYNPRRR